MFGKAARTDNWRPFFVKTETIIAGNAATALVALVFSILTGSALGIIGYGLLMAVTGALIDETLVEKANKFWGILIIYKTGCLSYRQPFYDNRKNIYQS